MSVRTDPKNPLKHTIDVGYGKNRERIPFDGTLAEALEWEAEIKRSRRPPTSADLIGATFAQCWPDYLLWLQGHKAKGTVDEYSYNWRSLSPVFGPFNLTSIDQNLVDRYKAIRLQAGKAKRTIVKELAVINSLLHWAVEEKKILTEKPRFKGYPRKETKAKIPIIWSDDEVLRLYNAIPDNRKLLIALIYQGGLRKSEAFKLKAEDVLTNCMVRILGKGNKERLVPIIDPDTWTGLEELAKATRRGWLFPNPRTKLPYKDIRTLLAYAKERCGINKRITPHLLRHSCFTHAIQHGVHPKAVQDWAGHESMETTQLYIHLAGDDIKREAEKMQRTFKRMKSGDR